MTDTRPRAIETGRLEAFSDGVFAIALTLLVLDLRVPPAGRFVAALAEEWASYLAYLAAFLTVGSIWLSHHNAFTRIQRVDAPMLVLNLALLLGASLVPWPASLISEAFAHGTPDDRVAAIAVDGLAIALLGLPWCVLSARLSARPHLLVRASDAAWMRRNAMQSGGSVVVAVVGVGLAFVSPVASLVLYLVVPAAFLVSSIRTITSE